MRNINDTNFNYNAFILLLSSINEYLIMFLYIYTKIKKTTISN